MAKLLVLIGGCVTKSSAKLKEKKVFISPSLTWGFLWRKKAMAQFHEIKLPPVIKVKATFLGLTVFDKINGMLVDNLLI